MQETAANYHEQVNALFPVNANFRANRQRLKNSGVHVHGEAGRAKSTRDGFIQQENLQEQEE